MRDLVRKMITMPSSGVGVGQAYGPAVEKSLEYIFSTGMEACLNGVIQKVVPVKDLKIAMEIFQLVLPRAQDKPQQCLAPKVIQLITNNLRVAVQQLVLNYPQSDAPAFDELYAIDLLGMVISTCEVQFFWSNVTSASAKPRNLAPRVLSAALKYNPEKEWLGNAFLRESGSDHELASSWLLGTLDVATLNSTPIACKVEDTPFSLASKQRSEGQEDDLEVKPHVRDSDSWMMLTDGIIYHMLRKDPVGICTMDPQILSLLREVASSCKFPTAVHASTNGLHDVETLYDLHLDVFQSFSRSAGKQWSSLGDLREKNQFRTKLMSNQFGIFISFLDAFKINFRRACTEIDRVNHNWHAFSELFLRQAGVNATGGRSYHEMDDTIKSFDERLTGLTTMFRFMYQCMDAFMFYCGEMAIGKSNLFFDAMQLLFRQVNSADGVRNVNEELRKGFCTGSMGFVDSVQLFFARQKYPSLLHWFAQTSEIYQTFNSGWEASPLKTLLVNILDPDGPLGIHSYYPGVESSNEQDIDVRTVRREAFYLSCGLFDCRCTNSFEHSRATSSCSRVHQLRQFVLGDFMRDTFTFVQRDGDTSLLETMVPLFQFVRAFQLNELHPCLEWMVECLIKYVPGEEVVNSTISCVLLTELCGIVCEAIAFNEHRPKLELIDLVELVLVYLQSVYVALSRRTTTMMSPFFAPCIEYPPSVKLSEYRFSPSTFPATDLLAAIGRVAQQCQASSDDRLRYFTTVAP
ncbi:hypothetical protein PHYSODRAFT_504939 [Phytophthora sojae]|uniref:Uncharacterized protein n=1 Tax=Phytophthora sojae (strain P6497) TaxID=1094619 RepID=G4ZMT7_PHYSP|nr:hypothetical protein PHYSODRAFT_504939 [Phytophthora sojae]EGZ16057.1 hypothetical protein PHYSODRAFT_504939 [Phytophthora sojae]|eukprot:XP_009529806.1 hypothetical protein PHYSODRAFT_504939 [Phytophthora sojae]